VHAPTAHEWPAEIPGSKCENHIHVQGPDAGYTPQPSRISVKALHFWRSLYEGLGWARRGRKRVDRPPSSDEIQGGQAAATSARPEASAQVLIIVGGFYHYRHIEGDDVPRARRGILCTVHM